MNRQKSLFGIELRKRTKEEILESPDKYIPKEDYLKYMMEKRKEYGYLEGDNIFSKTYNDLSDIAAGGKLELNEVKRSTKKNLVSVLKSFFKNLKKQELLDENKESKISRLISDNSYLDRKNPYRDKKFALAVANFQSQGLLQYDLKDILPEFINSKNGLFLREKYKQIDKSYIKKSNIHGIEHDNRVAMLSLMIAKDEGIIKEDSDREREILTYSAYYHDIGRILDVGPHSKRGAKIANNIEFRDLNYKKLPEKDINIIKMLIEGHEGSDKNIDKLLKKYQISDEDKNMAKNLLYVLKDADALDRSRLTINTPFATITDLDPKYLRLDTSKKLMNVSYALENLTHHIKNQEDILNYKNQNPEEHYYKNKNKLEDEIKVEVKELTPIEENEQIKIEEEKDR